MASAIAAALPADQRRRRRRRPRRRPDPADIDLELDAVGDPIELPDGKRIYPPRLHGEPIDELALRAARHAATRRARRFLRLVGPPGTGKSQIARAIAHRLWTEPRPRGRGPPRRAVLRLRRDAAGGPSSDEFFFRYEYVPVAERRRRGPRSSTRRSCEAMREGWVVMIDEVNTDPRRRAAVAQRHARRPPVAVPARRPARPSIARPGFAVHARLQPGPGRRDRHPRRLALALPRDRSRSPATGPALAELGARRALVARGDGARPPADRRRGRAGVDAAVPRHRGAVADESSASASAPRSRSSPPTCTSRSQAGKVQDAEARRRLPDARPGRLRPLPKVGASGGIPNLHGYPRAVTG